MKNAAFCFVQKAAFFVWALYTAFVGPEPLPSAPALAMTKREDYARPPEVLDAKSP
jgi:hypothetical protein